MIDTDKYEGHTDGKAWYWQVDNNADCELIADAPKLLAEVKRLREQLRLAKEWVDAYASHDSLSRKDFSKHIGDD